MRETDGGIAIGKTNQSMVCEDTEAVALPTMGKAAAASAQKIPTE